MKRQRSGWDEAGAVDLRDLGTLWTQRARRVAAVRERADPTGMTRPPRDPEEPAWLAARGRLGPFVEAGVRYK